MRRVQQSATNDQDTIYTQSNKGIMVNKRRSSPTPSSITTSLRRLNPVTLMAGACALIVLVLWVIALVK